MIIEDFMQEVGESSIREKLLNCLRSNPKTLPCTFFYDRAGSELFERITKLEEYYPPRIEIPLLRSTARKFNGELRGCDIVELGSGDCSKISIFLDEVPEENRQTIVYYPVDVSREAIEKSGRILRKRYPEMGLHGINADFLEHLGKIQGQGMGKRKGRKSLFCFFGSTIGNLDWAKAIDFLKDLDRVMTRKDRLLLGMDMVKDVDVLERAYNDSHGITAQFNKNILKVTNSHLGTDFNPDDFEHVAFFNRRYSRIEMHLRAKSDLEVTSPLLDESITFKKGETIHTENSHKYTAGHIRNMADAAGLLLNNIYTDDKKWFSLVEMVKG